MEATSYALISAYAELFPYGDSSFASCSKYKRILNGLVI